MKTEQNINPTSREIYRQLMATSEPVTEERSYTEKELVQFGNYLLSRERFDSLWEGHQHQDVDEIVELLRVVHQEDIDNAFNK